MVTKGVGVVPGAILCPDYNTVQTMFHMYSESWGEKAQDAVTHGQSELIRGKAMEPPFLKEYNCAFLPPGAPVLQEQGNIVPVIRVQSNGSWYRGVTLAGMTVQPSQAATPPPVVHSDASQAEITLDLSVNGNDQKPILNVTTNLPPKSTLMASLANPINKGGDGYFAQVSAAVQDNHVVQFGPFSKSGESLSTGTYQLTVTTVMAALQPEEVQPFFGAHGERLTGGLVSTLPGTSENGVSQTFQFTINPDGSANLATASTGR